MICEKLDICGGCTYPHDDYPKSLEGKQSYIENLFNQEVEPIIGMDYPYYYRNKVHGAFSYDRKNILMGKFEEGTHNVFEIEDCLIEDIKAQKINKSVKELVKSFRWSIYDEDTKKGLVRSTLVRVGKKSGEILLTIVLSNTKVPSKNNFVKEIIKLHPEIKSVVFNINDRNTSLILGQKEMVSYGSGYIFDNLLGLSFRISSQSFYQVNSKMTEVLYKKTLEFADLKGDETVLDAYCGIGTISLYIAGYCKKVYGVEYNKEAIKDAIFNAKINKIKNAYFTASDTGLYINKLLSDKIKIDVAIVDPARSGLDENAKYGLLNLNPEKIVYVSCNPDALKEDLKVLEEKYKVVKMQPVDLFPWTSHIETIALLQREIM